MLSRGLEERPGAALVEAVPGAMPGDRPAGCRCLGHVIRVQGQEVTTAASAPAS